jgi:hypothetical protein
MFWIVAELCHQIMKTSKEQQAVPFFNILSQLCLQRSTTPADTLDMYATLVAEQVWQCAEHKPVFFLQWLERAAPHSPVLLRSLTERLDLWVEKYLLKQVNSNARQGTVGAWKTSGVAKYRIFLSYHAETTVLAGRQNISVLNNILARRQLMNSCALVYTVAISERLKWFLGRPRLDADIFIVQSGWGSFASAL